MAALARGGADPAEDAALANLDDLGFLTAVYRKYLGRESDPSGREHYLPRVKTPGGRRQVIRALQGSITPETHT